MEASQGLAADARPLRRAPARAFDPPVGPSHPLRVLKARTDEALRAFEPVLRHSFRRGPSPAIKVTQVLRAEVLMTLYRITSERAFCAELRVNHCFRWFLELRRWDDVPDWWEFARQRRALVDTVVARCFLSVLPLEATGGGPGAAPAADGAVRSSEDPARGDAQSRVAEAAHAR